MPNSPFEIRTPFTDQDINEIETAIGRKLPEDYCKFVKKYGGAFVEGDAGGPDDLSILGFFAAEKYKGNTSLLHKYEDFTEIGSLPIAKCEFGNPYILTDENEVYYIDYSGTEVTATKVADSFQNFVVRISERTNSDNFSAS